MDDTPVLEYDGDTVEALKWVESGIGVWTENTGFHIVPEDTIFIAGLMQMRGYELNLRLGVEVTPTFARYGEDNEG